MRRRGLAATIGFGAALAPLAAWACVPAYDTPPTTLADRFAEGAWMVEARVTALEPEPSGFMRNDPIMGEPMSRAKAQVETVLWGSAPDKLRLRYWDEIFPEAYYWHCARYQPSFCEGVKPGDRLLILGEMDENGQTALDCFIAPEEGAAPAAAMGADMGAEQPDPADPARKAEAFRHLAAEARARILRLEAEAKAATPAKAYAAAMALAEAWAEYGDHPATDQAFRAAIAVDPKRPDAWLRLARHRLEEPERAYRAPPQEAELRIGLEALDAYLAAHGEQARVRSLRDELAAALGEPLDLERANLRGAALSSPQPIPLKGAPAGFDASQSRAAFAAAGAKLAGARFREAQIEGGDFTGADLRRADLRGVQALGVSFRNADLRGADLSEADLHEADLRGAKLGWALMGSADLRGADLTGANLAEAFLPSANFYAARLGGANLEFRDPENPLISLAGAFVDCATRPPKDFEPGRRGTIPLERVCDGEEQIADLSELNSLDDSPDSILILEGLDLRGARFARAGLSRRVEARIARADLSGASFEEGKAYLFWGAGARGQAKLAGANFRDAEILFNLPGADLRGADFTGAHVTGLKKNFDLGAAKFTGATLDFSAAGYAEPADLDALMGKADFSGALLLCGASARPAERRLWAALAGRLAEEGLTPSPACAEALAWSAANP